MRDETDDIIWTGFFFLDHMFIIFLKLQKSSNTHLQKKKSDEKEKREQYGLTQGENKHSKSSQHNPPTFLFFNASGYVGSWCVQHMLST